MSRFGRRKRGDAAWWPKFVELYESGNTVNECAALMDFSRETLFLEAKSRRYKFRSKGRRRVPVLRKDNCGSYYRVHLMKSTHSFLICKCHYYLLEGKHWCRTANGYIRGSSDRQYCFLHVLISGVNADHKNRIRHDNRCRNLRAATRSQQQLNRDGHSKMGHPKGVYFRKDRPISPYHSVIFFNGKKKYLGSFANMGDAAECYRKASLKYHGEFSSFYKHSVVVE